MVSAFAQFSPSIPPDQHHYKPTPVQLMLGAVPISTEAVLQLFHDLRARRECSPFPEANINWSLENRHAEIVLQETERWRARGRTLEGSL